ncbi:hypothetical protein [Spiroplasma helicoides]|nr:hypothetical protein [Spiroplasma helicoides]
MAKTKLFEMDKNFKKNVDKIYVFKNMAYCLHKAVSLDKRYGQFRCVQCFTTFNLDSRKSWNTFKKRLIKDFNFEEAEKELYKEITKKKRKNEIENMIKELHEIYN